MVVGVGLSALTFIHNMGGKGYLKSTHSPYAGFGFGKDEAWLRWYDGGWRWPQCSDVKVTHCNFNAPAIAPLPAARPTYLPTALPCTYVQP